MKEVCNVAIEISRTWKFMRISCSSIKANTHNSRTDAINLNHSLILFNASNKLVYIGKRLI